MEHLFQEILERSLEASWLILAVMLLRLVLKKAPRWLSVSLWGLVGLRLAVPFSLESPWSLVPATQVLPQTAIPPVGDAPAPVHPVPLPQTAGNAPFPIWQAVSAVWLAGMGLMLLYAAISYVRVLRQVSERVPCGDHVFLCDRVYTPFILGLLRPKIYLPSGMEEAAVAAVLAHERAHLKRRDHWWKPLGYLILTVYWFNPLCWAAYALLCRDIELACDEKVVRGLDMAGKKQYSAALLSCSTGRRLLTACPLAFGEVGVKERVKNVLNYKKPTFWVIILAILACVAVGVFFATSPREEANTPTEPVDEYQHLVWARIVGVEQNGFLVTPVEGSPELTPDVLLWVPAQDLSPEPQEGDVLEIAYDGIVMETYPGQLHQVYRIRVIDPAEQPSLREIFPEYFDLDTFKGLEVYAWEIGAGEYRFGLMPGTNREKTEEEKQALKGATAEEMALILSSYDVDSDSIFVLPREVQSVDPAYIQNLRAMLGLDAPTSTSSDEQTAIREAILAHNMPQTPRNHTYAASFVQLACLSGTPVAGETTHRITYYGWALYQAYQVTKQGLEVVTSRHTPVALSFDLDEQGYTVTEYWEPEDSRDVQEKFPADVVADALDGSAFLLRQTQNCYAQAVSASGMDVKGAIESLLTAICSSPVQASAPGAYIQEHPEEYQQLLAFGRETLLYCFTHFEEGGEVGLPGHIMATVCEDIAAGWGEALLMDAPVETGQDWYELFKGNALTLLTQFSGIELAERYPASYLLLSMLKKV